MPNCWSSAGQFPRRPSSRRPGLPGLSSGGPIALSSAAMRLFRHHTEIPVEARGAVVALGNFDGVHQGHQRVIGEAARLADELGVSCGLLTFEPHPREYFQPDRPAFRLTPFRIKLRQLEAIGVDYVYLLAFDPAMARRRPE